MKHLLFAIVAAGVFLQQPVQAYLQFNVVEGGRAAVLKWNRTPVRWFVKDRGALGVSSADFQAAASRAFATWEAVPTASISFQFGGFTGSEPFEDDGISVLGFQNDPDMDRVLGATAFVIDAVTGEIVESDIFFNSAFLWSVAPGGDPLRFDLNRSPSTRSVTSSVSGIRHSAKQS